MDKNIEVIKNIQKTGKVSDKTDMTKDASKINNLNSPIQFEGCVTGILQAKQHSDELVLNWGDSSCILIMDNFNILDMRKIPFDKLTAIEINGSRFVKEQK